MKKNHPENGDAQMSDGKYFVFQESQDGVQVEVGRKKRGAGRPPVGPNIMKTDDGNVFINNCLTTKPSKVASGVEYVAVEADNGVKVWYEKSKPASRTPANKYSLVDGKLVNDGPSGRGRPGKGYVKVTEDQIVDGVNLNGHFYNDGSEKTVSKKKAVVKNTEVNSDIDDNDDLEAQAEADAMHDMASEYEEVDIDVEEEVV